MPKIILQIAPSTQYFNKLCGVLKKLVGANKSLIYVTTNKSYTYVENLLKKKNVTIKKIFFIDCISKTIGSLPKEEPENCLFLDGPQEVTGLSLAINQAVKLLPRDKIVLFDSLSTLLIYNSEQTIGKFSNFIINKLRYKNISVILIALDSDADKRIIKTIGSFVDEVITK